MRTDILTIRCEIAAGRYLTDAKLDATAAAVHESLNRPKAGRPGAGAGERAGFPIGFVVFPDPDDDHPHAGDWFDVWQQ